MDKTSVSCIGGRICNVRNMRLYLVVFAAVVFTGCGEEVGRIPFSDLGSGETEVAIDAGKGIDFWTELDIKFEGAVGLVYVITLHQMEEQVWRKVCSPFDVSTKVKSVETAIGDSQSIKYSGKMRCSATVPDSGLVTVRVILGYVEPPVQTGSPIVTTFPESVQMEQANLVIKQ